ncbi:MAG: hypothetical protein GDA44_03920 [Prochloron sp. SP5CPC1]|nr:hypothetical protein [Candidatus Paraprochloron terpiosi SP5CPC1]
MRDKGGVTVKDRLYFLKKYPRCFVGQEAVEWLKNCLHISTAEALGIGQRLVNEKWIHHVCDEHYFEDGYLFDRFYVDEENTKSGMGYDYLFVNSLIISTISLLE